MQRSECPSFQVLRSSAKRLLRYLDHELARSGGQPVTVPNDMLEIVGSIRVWRPAMHELAVLGLVEVERTFKQHRVARSERWRDITTLTQAETASGRGSSSGQGANHAAGAGVMSDRESSPAMAVLPPGADALVFVDLNDAMAGPLGPSRQLMALHVCALRITRDANVNTNTFALWRHWTCSPVAKNTDFAGV